MNRILSFLIIFISAIFMMLEFNAFNRINRLYKDVEFRVFLSNEANVDSLKNIISNYVGIDDIIYISKDDAMIEFNKGVQNAKYLLNNIVDNPFPASFKVVFSSRHYKNIDFIANFSSSMLSLSGVTNVSYSKKWLNTLNVISMYLKWLSIGCGGLLVCFLLVILIIGINNNLIFYREEIKVLKDFGISTWNLKIRFGWKTLLWNTLFAIISIGFIYYGYNLLMTYCFTGKDFVPVNLPILFMIGFVGTIAILNLIVLLVNKLPYDNQI